MGRRAFASRVETLMIDKMLADQEKEYAERDRKLGGVPKEEAEREAHFLLKWSKGKTIRRIGPAADLCQSGRWCAKVPRRMAEAFIKLGLAVGDRDSFKMVTKGGAR